MNLDVFSPGSLKQQSGRIHFIGCGGAGTAPLMRLFAEKGYRVSGSDLLDNSRTKELRGMGLQVYTGHNKSNLPDAEPEHCLVVYTSAADDSNPELAEAKRRNMRTVNRGGALALLAKDFPQVISISGSHGKTTVTSMIAWILRHTGYQCGMLIGGSVAGWDANGSAGDGSILVTEVDESDGTHTLIHSTLGIVTNVEDDHAWSLGGADVLYHNFRLFAEKCDSLLMPCGGFAESLLKDIAQKEIIDPDRMWEQYGPKFRFPDQHWGHFLRYDAMIALRAAEKIGIPADHAVCALQSFPGVERRMTLRFDNGSIRIVEDYAHHPTELKESLGSFREQYPDRRLVIVFQPHRYARLERYFNEFASMLSTADLAFVTPVFAAWTGGGKYTSADLANAAGGYAVSDSWDDMAKQIAPYLQAGDLIGVIGAGDLPGLFQPLERLIEEK